ncbi:hypothetical protein WDZ92_44015, partial [Nostoc sp. NIES-2111]
MARSIAASAPAHAGAITGLARSIATPTYLKLVNAEPWLRRIVPAMMAVFILSLGTMAYVQSTAGRQETISDAIGDVDLLAAYLTSEFSRRSETLEAGAPPPPAVLGDILPPRLRVPGLSVVVTDPSGSVVAATGPVAPGNGTLVDLFGPAQPLTTFAEKAGVM